MSRDEAVELSTHYMGGLVWCESCKVEPYYAYEEDHAANEYDDAAFGQWLLAQGWHFGWQEHDHEGSPGSGKYPFMYYKPAAATSRSWSFSWVCPTCRRAGVA